MGDMGVSSFPLPDLGTRLTSARRLRARARVRARARKNGWQKKDRAFLVVELAFVTLGFGVGHVVDVVVELRRFYLSLDRWRTTS